MKRVTSRKEMQEVLVWETELTCDRCGFSVKNPEGEFNTITVMMDPLECVSFSRTRSYCADCSGAIWIALNEIISADPETIGSDREEEDW